MIAAAMVGRKPHAAASIESTSLVAAFLTPHIGPLAPMDAAEAIARQRLAKPAPLAASTLDSLFSRGEEGGLNLDSLGSIGHRRNSTRR